MALTKKSICSKLISSCNTTVKGFNTLRKFRITQDILNIGKFQFISDELFIYFLKFLLDL